MIQEPSCQSNELCTKSAAIMLLTRLLLDRSISLPTKRKINNLSRQISKYSFDNLSINVLTNLLSHDQNEQDYIYQRFNSHLAKLVLTHTEARKKPVEPSALNLANKEKIHKDLQIRLVEIILSRQLADSECLSLNKLYALLDYNLARFLEAILDGEEFQSRNNLNNAPALSHLGDSEFIIFAFISTLGRYPTPHELMLWSHEWLGSVYSRSEAFAAIQKSGDPLFLQNSLVLKTFGRNAVIGHAISHSSSPSATVMGSGKVVDSKNWEKSKQRLVARSANSIETIAFRDKPSNIYTSTILDDSDAPILSIITSLYNADEFIKPFLENIVGQVGFHAYELLIIDACSPGSEKRIIDEYAEKYSNIVYHRCKDRITIYDAWNLGVAMSRGKYLTNANLDDLRAPNGLSIQVTALEVFSSFDIVYGDFFYFFEPNPPWSLVDRVGIKSKLSHLSPEILLTQNYPHCAPVWRKSLHEDIGIFDVSYKSAADWEFWIRCMRHEKKFLYVPLALSGYYQNPNGISTSAETKGVEEVAEIYSNHFKDLIMTNDSPLMMSQSNLNRLHPSSQSLPLKSHLINSYIELHGFSRLINPDNSFVSIQ